MCVQKTSLVGQHQNPQATMCQSFEQMTLTKLIKIIDRLQCVYGLPPPSRHNTTQDLVFPEFASIWATSLHSTHICQTLFPKIDAPDINPQLKYSSFKTKFKRSAGFLESIPLKLNFSQSQKFSKTKSQPQVSVN